MKPPGPGFTFASKGHQRVNSAASVKAFHTALTGASILTSFVIDFVFCSYSLLIKCMNSYQRVAMPTPLITKLLPAKTLQFRLWSKTNQSKKSAMIGITNTMSAAVVTLT